MKNWQTPLDALKNEAFRSAHSELDRLFKHIDMVGPDDCLSEQDKARHQHVINSIPKPRQPELLPRDTD